MPLHVGPLRSTTLPWVCPFLIGSSVFGRERHFFLSSNSSITTFQGQPYKLHPKDFGERTQAPAHLETGRELGEALALGPRISCLFAFYRSWAVSRQTRKHSPSFPFSFLPSLPSLSCLGNNGKNPVGKESLTLTERGSLRSEVA